MSNTSNSSSNLRKPIGAEAIASALLYVFSQAIAAHELPGQPPVVRSMCTVCCGTGWAISYVGRCVHCHGTGRARTC